MLISSLVLWVLTVANLLTVVILFRQFGLLYMGSRETLAVQGLQVGQRVGSVEGTSLAWRSAGPDAFTVVLLSNTDCPISHAILGGYGDLVAAWEGACQFVVARRPGRHDLGVPELPAEVVLVESAALHERFDIDASPYVFFVSPGGEVRERRLVNTVQEISRLLAYHTDDRMNTPRKEPAVG